MFVFRQNQSDIFFNKSIFSLVDNTFSQLPDINLKNQVEVAVPLLTRMLLGANI